MCSTDVLIITAVKDEYDVVVKDSVYEWTEEKDNSGFPYHRATIDGLKYAIARPNYMGGDFSSNITTRLTTELKPKCLAMIGICAGRRGEVFLGDVIVADSVYRYDSGKIKRFIDRDIKKEEFFNEIRTYNLDPLWLRSAQDFDDDWINKIQRKRPLTYDLQKLRALNNIYCYQYKNGEDPKNIIETDYPDWEIVITKLKDEEKVLFHEGSFKLSEKGKNFIEEKRALNPKNEYKEQNKPNLYVGSIATGNKVVEDKDLFKSLIRLNRKTIGVEMEAAAVAVVADIERVGQFIVAKAVSDYGDHDKDDKFRSYAIECSYRFLIEFLKENFKPSESKVNEFSNKILSKHISDVNTFIGREDDLIEIKKRLDNNKRLLIINGLGGVGKTTVARRFLEEYKNDYDHIIWIQANTGIKAGLLNDEILCSNLRIVSTETDKRFLELINKLHNIDGKNLMVLDDVKGELKSNELPQTNWDILITSRSSFEDIEKYKLGFLPEEDALKLFYSHYKIEKDDEIVKEILRPIAYHTLTTELFAKSANKRIMKLLKLRDQIEEAGFNIKGNISVQHTDVKVENILEYMNKVFPLNELLERELFVLRQFVMFPSEFIDKEDLDKNLELSDFEDEIENLAEQGWLEENKTGYKLHQVIQQLILKNYPVELDYYKQYIDLIANLLSLEQTKENPIYKIKWRLYGDKLLSQFTIATKELSLLTNNLGMVYKTLGLYKKAAELLKTTLDSSIKYYGEEDPAVAVIQSNLALVYRNLGLYNDAEDLLKKSLESNIRNYGEDHPNVALSRSNLGLVYGNLGLYNDAEDLLKKALESNIKNYGEDHPAVSVNQSNLAIIYKDFGLLEKARDLQKLSLNSSIKYYGENHPTVSVNKSNLGMIYKDLGLFKEAAELLESALEWNVKNYGKDHPIVALSRANLGLVYQNLGYNQKTAGLFKSVLESTIKIYGKEHPNVAACQSNLALVYQDLGLYEKASVLLELALGSNIKNFGKNHYHVALSQSNLGLVYGKLGLQKKATKLLESALEIVIKNFGEDHPNVAVIRSNLATLKLSFD